MKDQTNYFSAIPRPVNTFLRALTSNLRKILLIWRNSVSRREAVAVPQLKDHHQEESRGVSPKVSLETIRAHANDLSEQLNIQRKKMYPPVAQKTLRKFTSGEAAKLVG